MKGSSNTSAAMQVIAFALPWALRRPLLNILFGFDIDRSARIGVSLVLTNRLIMAAGARIGHANLVRKLDTLVMARNSAIFSRNQITGCLEPGTFPEGDRDSCLCLGAHAAITHHHILDCADSISIGDFTVLAGYHSQILTHDIDVLNYRMATAPVVIGSNCYIGAGTIITKGAHLPACCVVGAGSVLRGLHTEEYCFLAGVPAKKIKDLPHSAGYFASRQ